MPKPWTLALAGGLLAALVPAPSALEAQAVGAVGLIRHATLIDGTGKPPRNDVSILIEGGRIARIVGGSEIQAPADGLVIDASGKTVIPGMVNLRGAAWKLRGPPPFAADWTRAGILEQLGIYASYGVTTVASVSPGDGPLAEGRSRRDERPVPNLARALTPFQTLVAARPGRPPGEAGSLLSVAVTSAAQARREVNRLADAGADFIQVQAGLPSGQALPDRAILAAAIQRAKRRGLRVGALASNASRAAELVEAGADFLLASVTDREIDAEFIDTLARNGAVYAPALRAESGAFEYGDDAWWLNDRYLRRSMPAGVSGFLRGPVRIRQALDPDRARKARRFGIARRNLRRLAEAGVRIGLASGSGLPGSFPGYAEYREAVLMKRAGLANLEVIRALASGGAAALDLARDRGGLAPGQFADLIILNANPLDNIHKLRELHAVLIGGRLVKL